MSEISIRANEKSISNKIILAFPIFIFGLLLFGLIYFLDNPFEKPATFKAIDEDGNNISSVMRISVYTMRNDIIINNTEDIKNIDNYKLAVNNKICEYITIDLRNIECIYVLIDPTNTTIFKTEYKLFIAGNIQYTIYCSYY